MEAAKDSVINRDWSGLHLIGDMLLIILRVMHIVDAVRSGAVCKSWWIENLYNLHIEDNHKLLRMHLWEGTR